MELINIYGGNYIHRHYMALYNLLAERELYQSISHKQLPEFPEHVKFVDSNPYMCWYGIWDEGIFHGSIYIGKENNIGIFLRKIYVGKGIGKDAIKKIIELHPLPYYLANIAPHNSGSLCFFSNFGFKHFQSFLLEEKIEKEDKVGWKCDVIQYIYKFTPSDVKA